MRTVDTLAVIHVGWAEWMQDHVIRNLVAMDVDILKKHVASPLLELAGSHSCESCWLYQNPAIATGSVITTWLQGVVAILFKLKNTL